MTNFFKKPPVFIACILLIVYGAAGLYFAHMETNAFEAEYGFPVLKGGDSQAYAFLAKNILAHGAFSSSESSPYVAEMFRSPGYSLFLVPFLYVFNSFIPVVFVQALLAIASALIIYAVGRAFFSEKIATGAAFVFALNPAIIFYTFTILSDILFLFLFLLGVYLIFCKAVSSEKYPRVFVSLGAILLGYATLVRPAGLYSIGIILVFIALYHAKRVGIKRALSYACLCAVLYSSVLAPWYIRNYNHSGSLALSSIGPYTLLFYNVAGFLADKNNVDTNSVKQELREKHFPGVRIEDLQSGRHTKEIGTFAVRYITEDPLGYALYHSKGSINFFIASSFKDVSNEAAVFRKFLLSTPLLDEDNVSLKEYLKRDGVVHGSFRIVGSELLFSLERAWWLLIALSALISPLLLWKKPEERLLILLFFCLVGYFALVFGPVSYPRYRIASEPFLILLASGSLWALLPSLQKGFTSLKNILRLG